MERSAIRPAKVGRTLRDWSFEPHALSWPAPLDYVVKPPGLNPNVA
jgi:hypothetical protein